MVKDMTFLSELFLELVERLFDDKLMQNPAETRFEKRRIRKGCRGIVLVRFFPGFPLGQRNKESNDWMQRVK